jgi:hypothetical protein
LAFSAFRSASLESIAIPRNDKFIQSSEFAKELVSVRQLMLAIKGFSSGSFIDMCGPMAIIGPSYFPWPKSLSSTPFHLNSGSSCFSWCASRSSISSERHSRLKGIENNHLLPSFWASPVMLLEKLIESRCLVLIPVSNVIDGNDFGR